MNVRRVILGILLAVVGLNAGRANETKPADPFDGLVAATSALADMAQQLKPASGNVTVKQEAVGRKEAELAEAKAAEVTAKAEFNEVLADFLKAIDLLKEAALKIQPIAEPTPAL